MAAGAVTSVDPHTGSRGEEEGLDCLTAVYIQPTADPLSAVARKQLANVKLLHTAALALKEPAGPVGWLVARGRRERERVSERGLDG